MGWKSVKQGDDVSNIFAPESASSSTLDSDTEEPSGTAGRQRIKEKLRQKIYVEHFGSRAGAIMENENLQNYGCAAYADKENLHSPFLSELDWKVAQWAKLRGPSSAAITELLQIPTVSSLFFSVSPNNFASWPKNWVYLITVHLA